MIHMKVRVRSKYKVQLGHSNENTTLTTDHKYIKKDFISLTKIINKAYRNWAHFLKKLYFENQKF